MGYGACVLRGVTVGDNRLIGTYGVVSEDIPARLGPPPACRRGPHKGVPAAADAVGVTVGASRRSARAWAPLREQLRGRSCSASGASAGRRRRPARPGLAAELVLAAVPAAAETAVGSPPDSHWAISASVAALSPAPRRDVAAFAARGAEMPSAPGSPGRRCRRRSGRCARWKRRTARRVAGPTCRRPSTPSARCTARPCAAGARLSAAPAPPPGRAPGAARASPRQVSDATRPPRPAAAGPPAARGRAATARGGASARRDACRHRARTGRRSDSVLPVLHRLRG